MRPQEQTGEIPYHDALVQLRGDDSLKVLLDELCHSARWLCVHHQGRTVIVTVTHRRHLHECRKRGLCDKARAGVRHILPAEIDDETPELGWKGRHARRDADESLEAR